MTVPNEDRLSGTRRRVWPVILARAGTLRTAMVGLGLIMIGVGAIDALFPLLNGIAVDTFLRPAGIGGTGGAVGFAGFALTIGGFSVLYGCLAVVQAFLVWALIALAGHIEMGIMYRFRDDAFVHLQNLSLSYFDRTPAGWILSRLTSDIQRLGETIAWGLVDVVWGIAMMVAIAVAMLIINVRLALLVLSVVPPLALLSFYFQRKILGVHRNIRRLNSEVTAGFSEGIAGVATSKTLVREEENLRSFTVLTGSMRRSAIRAAVISALYLPLVLLIGSIGTSIALVAGGVGFRAGTVTLGTVVAFVGYTVQFFEPVREVARVLTELQSARSAAERVQSLLDTEPEIRDRRPPHQESRLQCDGRITFENVCFAYAGGEPVLEDFSLEIPAGQSVAFIGETGAGKSTIVNLVSRFYQPDSGRLLIDGVDQNDHSISWMRSQLGYVLQTPILFQGTVAENIRFGRPDASDAEVVEAAKNVAAHELITRFPGGYDYLIGEGGSGLSTGQKQLISFARALLANPRIVILDEATSSVDSETELRIQRAIRVLLTGRTSLIIAHRLSTVRDADRILVLDEGKIVEDGTHDALITRGAHYSRLYREQFVV